MNEETIAGIVGWGKTLGCIASSISVNLPEPGHIHRGAGKGGAAHTVFRAGEVHGRITQRAEDICRLVGYADSAMVTGNLWGERWSKLVANVMGNGLSACTGLTGGEMLQSEPIRRFSTRLGSEAIRVGQAHGYQLEEILHLPPETIARAGEGDEAAMRACDERRFKDGQRTASEQRPSMGQDMQKGRRTEIELCRARGLEGRSLVRRQCHADGHRQTRGTQRAKPRSAAHHRAPAELILLRQLYLLIPRSAPASVSKDEARHEGLLTQQDQAALAERRQGNPRRVALLRQIFVEERGQLAEVLLRLGRIGIAGILRMRLALEHVKVRDGAGLTQLAMHADRVGQEQVTRT
jgi:hypothetical protein